MHPPTFKWEWNVNTIAVLAGFAAGFVAWGYTLNDVKQGKATNGEKIERLETRVATLEAIGRTLDNHELRLTNVEIATKDAAAASRAVDATLNGLTTDVRVVKEILQRIEASQNERVQK